MTTSRDPLHTLVVYGPLNPPTLIDHLRTFFPVVHHFPVPNPFAPADQIKDSELPTADALSEADAIFSFTVPGNLKSAEQVPRLKLFQGLSAGYGHISDTEFVKSLTDEKITFANASGIHVSTIGEHVLGTVLMLYHKLHTIAVMLHNEQRWVSHIELGGNYIRELNTLKVGIIGYGHIGRETARLFHSCGSTILALTRSGLPSPIGGFLLPHTGDPAGVLPEQYYSSASRESTLAFFADCDVVVNTLPDSEATRGFVGEEELKAMKGDGVYVNIGRGTTTDQEALVKALQAKPAEGEEEDATGSLRIGGASLDVTQPEPLPTGHPLYTLPNVVLTPHMSGQSKKYFENAAKVLEVNVERMRAGRGALNAWRGKGEEQ
ncbi:hypothetical protein JCM6882_008413 [Rhodosporidiobolus microsporus]